MLLLWKKLWLCNLLTKLGHKFNVPSTFFVDQNSAIAMDRQCGKGRSYPSRVRIRFQEWG